MNELQRPTVELVVVVHGEDIVERVFVRVDVDHPARSVFLAQPTFDIGNGLARDLLSEADPKVSP